MNIYKVFLVILKKLDKSLFVREITLINKAEYYLFNFIYPFSLLILLLYLSYLPLSLLSVNPLILSIPSIADSLNLIYRLF